MPSNESIWTILNSLATLAAAAAATFSFVAASKAIRLARKTFEGQILLRLVEQAGSAVMLRHMRRLRQWSEKGHDFAVTFGNLRRNKETYKQVRRLDESRRAYKHYFWQLERLISLGIISPDFVKGV